MFTKAPRDRSRYRAAAPPFLIPLLMLPGCGDAPAPPPGDGPLLIDGGTVVVMDESGRILEGAAVVVEGDRISAVIAAGGPRPGGARVIDATGHLVIPGLVNTHGHAAMSLLRGLADDLPLMTWLNDYIFPAEAALVAPDFVYWGTLLSSVEMLKSGTTTFADMYYFRDDMARATIDAGHPLGDRTPRDRLPHPRLRHPRGLARRRRAEFMERYRDHPTVVPAVAAHALYTTPLEAVEAAFRLAEEYDAPFQIHAVEDPSEDVTARELTGMGVIEALESIGALRPGTVLAHSIYLSDEDIARIAAGGAGIAHNPQSNMKLGVARAAPVAAALEAGIPVGIGTDGPASNNDLDMFDEMDAAAKVQKFMLGDPAALPAETVFRMATHGRSARARPARRDRVAGAGQARRHRACRHAATGADAAVQRVLAPGVRGARQRRGHRDRERAGGGARPRDPHRGRGGGDGAGAGVRGPGSRGDGNGGGGEGGRLRKGVRIPVRHTVWSADEAGSGGEIVNRGFQYVNHSCQFLRSDGRTGRLGAVRPAPGSYLCYEDCR